MIRKSYPARDLVVEMIKVADLHPYARNARFHSRSQIKRIADSIETFGYTSPILVDERNEIIAGHGRLEAAKALGMEEIPVIRLAGLTEAQRRALRLADNKIAERSSWTPELLRTELEFLIEQDFEIEQSGFDIIEVDRLLAPSTASQVDEPPLPALGGEVTSRDGDLWLLGQHRELCGDSGQPSILERLLAGRSADMVATDPPYNVAIPGHVRGKGRTRHENFQMASGEMDDHQFMQFLATSLALARDSSRSGSLHYVCMDWGHLRPLLNVGYTIYSRLMNVCVWCKPNAGMGSFYRSQHEFVVVFKHGNEKHINNIQLGRLGRNRSNVWQYPGVNGFSASRAADLADHPTVKPTAMFADAIRDATSPGDLVLDPFGGSGTTLLAAEMTGRRAALVEIDPRYVDVILKRFAAMTGVEPVLESTGEPLSAVAKIREGGQS